MVEIPLYVFENTGWVIAAVASLYVFLNYGGALSGRAQGAKKAKEMSLTGYALRAIRIDIKVLFIKVSKALSATLLFIFAFKWLGAAVGGLVIWQPEVWASFVVFVVSSTNATGLTDFTVFHIAILVVAVMLAAWALRQQMRG